MALQTVINGRQVPGIAGEFSDTSVKTARQYLVYGKDASSKPTFGKVFALADKALITGSSETTTVAVQGIGDGTKALGILVNPKEHFTYGFDTTLEMDAATAGTIATRGHVWVMVASAVNAGDPVYADADGNLGPSTLASSKKVLGATWLKTVAAPVSPKTEVLAEVAIDNPTLDASGEG